MKTFHGGSSPFVERPFFHDAEIDQMCEDALRNVSLLPGAPEPVRIERFIEKHFKVTPTYEDLPKGVLGFTSFSKNGVASIHVANALLEDETKVAERRLNSTLAHEAGHGLMHAYLFAFHEAGLSVFGKDPDVSSTKVLCRDADRPGNGGYDGRWWEQQANKAIGSHLLPRPAFKIAVEPFLARCGDDRKWTVSPERLKEATRTLAETFEVNPVVVQIRIKAFYPFESETP